MKVERDACCWCYGLAGGIHGPLELFEKEFTFHRSCYIQMQEIKPQLIQELKAKASEEAPAA